MICYFTAWAVKHGLWGHALFLSSKIGKKMHMEVMMAFANRIPMNDPLQTLYQHLSGRVPAAVTVSILFYVYHICVLNFGVITSKCFVMYSQLTFKRLFLLQTYNKFFGTPLLSIKMYDYI